MRTRWKWIIGICFPVIVIQLMQPGRSNPTVNPAQTIDSKLAVDAAVAATFARSCKDCHSKLTVWPWYSNVALVSWLVVSDVRRGRSDLNLSEWGFYPLEKQQELLKEVCAEVSSKEMPGSVYTIMHPKARLSDADTAFLFACGLNPQIKM